MLNKEFKGAIAEQYVLQQFKIIKDLPVFYWSNETSRAEIDFVGQYRLINYIPNVPLNLICAGILVNSL